MDREKFFKEVKGKKIHWGTRPSEKWFIPEAQKDGLMIGKDQDGERDTWFIGGGFSTGSWYFWSPVRAEEVPRFPFSVLFDKQAIKIGCREINLEQALIFHAILEEFLEGT